ncbi:MAG: hypothetical protein J4F40_20100, partial [Alphaproteobacteria bacterium]|nr:hypothetical protein [Alphaproteobacteria bacterium]
MRKHRSSRSPTSVWWRTCSTCCPNSRRSWRRLASDDAGKGVTAAEIRKIGVIGAGQMGNGIAHVSALAGYDVILNDINQNQLEDALATIEKNMSRQVSRGTIGEDESAAALARISTSTGMNSLADADLVIESAVENEQVKIDIFSALCPLLKSEALIASNTSSISITRLAATTDRPE